MNFWCMSDPDKLSSLRLRKVAGFTLLEITLAIGVFATLLVGVFGVVVASTELAGDLAYSQEQAIGRRAMRNLLRRAFAELPAEGSLELRDHGSGESAGQEIVFPPDFCVFRIGGADHDYWGEVVLRTEERTGGYLAVVLVWRAGEDQANGEDDTPLDLISEVAEFRWRFFDAAAGEWQETWDPIRGRPRLVELVWEMAGSPASRDVFAVYPLASVGRSSGASSREKEQTIDQAESPEKEQTIDQADTEGSSAEEKETAQ